MISMHNLVVPVVLMGSLTVLNSVAANIKITETVVRAVPAVSGNTAGYMTLVNRGDKPVRLQSVDSDLAARTEIHGHSMKDGMMKMYKVSDGLELPPKKVVKLETGGYHIMLMGLKAELQEGDSVDLTLHFSDGDAIDVTIPVKSLQEPSGI